MGRQKLLLPWAGKTLVRHIVDELVASKVSDVVVVSGPSHNEVRDCLSGVEVQMVRNPKPEEGMLTSVRIGLSRMHPSSQAFMVVLGDQPSLSTCLVDGVIGYWHQHSDAIVRPVYAESHGHPVIIPREFESLVMTQFDDVGLKGLLRKYPGRVKEWFVSDPGVIEDIDTPEDYERELARWKRGGLSLGARHFEGGQ